MSCVNDLGWYYTQRSYEVFMEDHATWQKIGQIIGQDAYLCNCPTDRDLYASDVP